VEDTEDGIDVLQLRHAVLTRSAWDGLVLHLKVCVAVAVCVCGCVCVCVCVHVCECD